MKKYIRKSVPTSAYDLPAFESWLSDLAQEGLFLVSLNGYGGKFRRDVPKKMTYRVEIPKYFDTRPPKKMEEMYQEFGWEFICTYYQNGFIFASEADDPVELHTDPITQSEGIRDFYKEQRNECIACLIFLPLLAAATIGLKWTNLAETLTVPFDIKLIIMWLYLCFGMFLSIKELRSLKKMKTELEMGIPMEHRKPYKKRSFIRNLFLIYAIALLLAAALEMALIYTKHQDNSFSINEVSSPIPFVSLGELDGTGHIGETDISYESTILAPVQYNIYTDKDDSHLHMYYMDVRPAFLAKQTMETIARNGMFDGLSGFRFYITGVQPMPEVPLDIPPAWFDKILCYEEPEDGETYLTAYKGNKVIAVKYTGTDDFAAHLDKFSILLDEEYGEPHLISN
ncbi:MAG: DUF2812 domain-containing protein [Anaerotignum sp.]|nr:DUF2812 domain-containing protein [Anaerotignum sp.]